MLFTPSRTVAQTPEDAPCGAGSARPNGLGASEVLGHLAFNPRVRLVTIPTVSAIRGVSAEAVAYMVDDALHPQHLRFAFHIGLGSAVRELRFYVDELTAPAMVRNFTAQDVVARVLGGRPSFRRAEIELAWTCSSNLLTRLIRANLLKLDRGRLLRSDLEAFLLARWSGNNPN